MWSQSSSQENSLVDLIGGAGASKKAGQAAAPISLLESYMQMVGNAV